MCLFHVIDRQSQFSKIKPKISEARDISSGEGDVRKMPSSKKWDDRKLCHKVDSFFMGSTDVVHTY